MVSTCRLHPRYSVSPARLLLVPVVVACLVAALAGSALAAPPVNSIAGTWQRVIHCQDVVRALTAAGFGDNALDAAGEFVHVTSEGVADAANPCRGALPERHSHFFTADGQFGSLDENGDQVDEGTYEIVAPGTLVMPYGFEHGPPIPVTFHFRIHGNTISFDPVIPNDCSTSQCREATAWSVTVALSGKTWRRVVS
jgi:hypothetical protein